MKMSFIVLMTLLYYYKSAWIFSLKSLTLYLSLSTLVWTFLDGALGTVCSGAKAKGENEMWITHICFTQCYYICTNTSVWKVHDYVFCNTQNYVTILEGTIQEAKIITTDHHTGSYWIILWTSVNKLHFYACFRYGELLRQIERNLLWN